MTLGIPRQIVNDKHYHITIAQELRDLISAVEEFKRRGREKIILAGSSMGGVIALMYGGLNSKKIDSIITLSFKSTFSMIFEVKLGSVLKFNPFFAATDNYIDVEIGKTLIPKMWSSDKTGLGELPEQEFDMKPRLFHFKGYGKYFNEEWIFGNSPASNKIPKAMQIGTAPQYASTIDLDFETLFNKFYLKNFSDIQTGSIVKGDVLIDLEIFKNTDFRKPKLIRYKGMNVYLRLLKISEFKLGGDKKTSCQFIYWKG